jgi:2-methylcitrate dehydratase PrpD
VARRARYIFLDTIGAALAGRNEMATLQMRSVFRETYPLAASDVPLLLGVAAQSADLDETNLRANCHIAAAVVPAIIGATLETDLSGSILLEALTAGYEFEAIIGEALAPRHGQKGWHPSGTLGAFGAAFAASHALGLDAAATWRAIGIAATQASGVKSVFGGSAKPLNLGRAAQAGLLAARLAQAGMTAPQDPFESTHGFFSAAGALPFMPGRALRHPILDNHFKFLPCCIETHAAAYGAAKVSRGKSRSGKVHIVLAPSARALVDRPAPTSLDEARFSVQYAVARGLQDVPPGVKPEPFDPHLLPRAPQLVVEQDAILGHLCARIHCAADSQDDTIVTDLGAVGSLDAAALDSKFDALAEEALGAQTRAVRKAILDIETASAVSELLGRLTRLITMRDIEPLA